MADPTFSEQFGLVIGAIATMITAIGGVAIIKGRKETKAGEGPSQGAAIKAAIERQTEVIRDEGDEASKERQEILGTLRSMHIMLVELRARRD